MKAKIILMFVSFSFYFSIVNAQIKVLSDGSTTLLGSCYTGGIRISLLPFSSTGYILPCIYPSSPWALTLGTANNHIAGAYISHNWSNIYDSWPSDKRLKNNIQKIDSAIFKIKLLNPVKYNLNRSLYDSVPEGMRSVLLEEGKNRLGFIAQELQTVFPQSVHKEPISGYYGISTMDLIPVLVQAIKEQQTMIEELQQKILGEKKLLIIPTSDSISNLTGLPINETKKYQEIQQPLSTSLLSETEKEQNIDLNDEPSLQQNSPNPFNSATIIDYYLPIRVSEATIYIYDLQGLQKKSITITGVGKGSVTIFGSMFSAGMYYYTLIVDGKEVDTKKMILTE